MAPLLRRRDAIRGWACGRCWRLESAAETNQKGRMTKMTPIRRATLTVLALTLAVAGSLHATGEGRIIGTVVDESGAPVEGAKILLTRAGTSYKLEKTSDKKGQFMLLILDATQEYQLQVEKSGFNPYTGPIKPKLED